MQTIRRYSPECVNYDFFLSLRSGGKIVTHRAGFFTPTFLSKSESATVLAPKHIL